MRKYENGILENEKHCIVEVKYMSTLYAWQCCRYRGYGKGEFEDLLCKLHARMQRQGKLLRIPVEEKP